MGRDVQNWLTSRLHMNLMVKTQCKQLKMCVCNFQHGLSFRAKQTYSGQQQTLTGAMFTIWQINSENILLRS